MKLQSSASLALALAAAACLPAATAIKHVSREQLDSLDCPHNYFPKPSNMISSLGSSFLDPLGDMQELQTNLEDEEMWAIGAWWSFTVTVSSSCHYSPSFGFSGGGNGFLTFSVPPGALDKTIHVTGTVKESGAVAKFASRYEGTMTDCSVNFTNFCLVPSPCDSFECSPSSLYSKKASGAVGNSTMLCCDVRYCKDDENCSSPAGEYTKKNGWGSLKGSTKGQCCISNYCSDSDFCNDTKWKNKSGTGIRGSSGEQCCEPARCTDHACSNPKVWSKLPGSVELQGSTDEECCEMRTCNLVNCTPSSLWRPKENPSSAYGYTLVDCCDVVSCENYTCSEPTKYYKTAGNGTVVQGSDDEHCCTPRLCSAHTCSNKSLQLVALSQATPMLGSTDEECCDLKFCKQYTCSDPTQWVHKANQDINVLDQRGFSDEECCSPVMCYTYSCDPPSKWSRKNETDLYELQGSTDEQCCDKVFCKDFICSTATAAEGEASRGTAYYKRKDTNNFMWQGSTDDECCLPMFCSQYITQYPSKWRRKKENGLKGSTDVECYEPKMCATVPGSDHDSYCCLGEGVKLRADALNVSGSTDEECCIPMTKDDLLWKK